MARKKIPMRLQTPQVKPSADGTGQAASQPQVQQPVQAQPGQAQAAQAAKPQVQPIQQSQPIQK